LALALIAPIVYEVECCATVHDECARADFQTGCNACANEGETVALTIREFTPPTSRPSIPPLQLSAHDCGALESLDWAAFGLSSGPASVGGGSVGGSASPPLFILHSCLLV